MTRQVYTGAAVFDGEQLHSDTALVVEKGAVAALVPSAEAPADAEQIALAGGTLAPGFVDLQVNGGGGLMFNDDPSVETLRIMAEAHGRLGATTILPTLITDTPEVTRTAIDAAVSAVEQELPGMGGLHLEGPHLSQVRKGAHDPALIRPMTEEDLSVLLEASDRLPALLVTVAPESVTNAQISRLSEAGIVVSLGHSDCSLDVALAAQAAGASCVTHLFNAMSQLGNREPGLVGAALAAPGLSAGLIADGIHVHPETMRAALAAKTGPGRIFLVSDAMAVAGSELTEFTLNGRMITRRDSRLTLADGTLAGADLDLATAISTVARLGGPLEQALAMATGIPAALIGREARLSPGAPAEFVHLDEDLHLTSVWRAGKRL